ncbi:MAG: hypothetical protein Q8P42_06225 [Gallionella sp.]|nr:hypothetical protein [Gallionella sp.]
METLVRFIIVGLLLLGGYYTDVEFEAFQEKQIQAGAALLKK